MVQPSPIVVCAVMWTWLISLQLAPMVTLGPMMQSGPIEVPSPMTAPSSIRAVGSILLISLLIRQHRANIGFCDGDAIDLCVAVKPPHVPAPAHPAHMVLNGLARKNRFTKFAIIDREKVDHSR